MSTFSAELRCLASVGSFSSGSRPDADLQRQKSCASGVLSIFVAKLHRLLI